MRSSLRFFRVKISFVLFLVSSIFFQVFCSSCLRRAMRLASNWASLSILKETTNPNEKSHLLTLSCDVWPQRESPPELQGKPRLAAFRPLLLVLLASLAFGLAAHSPADLVSFQPCFSLRPLLNWNLKNRNRFIFNNFIWPFISSASFCNTGLIIAHWRD